MGKIRNLSQTLYVRWADCPICGSVRGADCRNEAGDSQPPHFERRQAYLDRERSNNAESQRQITARWVGLDDNEKQRRLVEYKDRFDKGQRKIKLRDELDIPVAIAVGYLRRERPKGPRLVGRRELYVNRRDGMEQLIRKRVPDEVIASISGADVRTVAIVRARLARENAELALPPRPMVGWQDRIAEKSVIAIERSLDDEKEPHKAALTGQRHMAGVGLYQRDGSKGQSARPQIGTLNVFANMNREQLDGFIDQYAGRELDIPAPDSGRDGSTAGGGDGDPGARVPPDLGGPALLAP